MFVNHSWLNSAVEGVKQLDCVEPSTTYDKFPASLI